MADQGSVFRAREKGAVIGIAIVVVAVVANTVALVARVVLLQRIRDGGSVTFEEAAASDDRALGTGVALAIAAVVGGILWLRWQHRSQKTLVDLGYHDLTSRRAERSDGGSCPWRTSSSRTARCESCSTGRCSFIPTDRAPGPARSSACGGCCSSVRVCWAGPPRSMSPRRSRACSVPST